MSSSWFPFFKRPNVALANEDDYQLLPTNAGISHGEYEDDDQEIELEMRRFTPDDERRPALRGWLRRYWPVVLIFGVLALLFVAASNQKPKRAPARDYWNISNARVDALFARQSTTLDQAMARYSLRNNRAPPPMYDKWFEFARERSCLIDEYNQISRDFEPFYQLAKDDPAYFKKMVDKGTPWIQEDGRELRTGVFAGNKFSFTDEQWTLYNVSLSTGVMSLASSSTLVYLVRGKWHAMSPIRRRSGTHPRPTASYFQDEMKCAIPMRPKGFTGLANDASAFMLFASSTDFTTDLYPVMSTAKIACFADILVPSEFYYTDSGWAPSYGYGNNITWDDKKEKLYWRGMTSGGWVYGENYHAFPRYRLIDIGRKHTDLMDVKLSGFHEGLCGENCDREKIKQEYSIATSSSPREDVYNFKYLFDVDGNSFSGRYLGLLRSGSLVFKSTVFAEYFNDWLTPFEHYIPILPDLSDLVEKLEWAVAHDNEARAIQQAGQVFTERVITDAQNDCYFSAVMLEWARLYNMASQGQEGHAPVPDDMELATD
ncbi:CAP10 domain-containing protein [Mycena venus]|uniref:CAP10 domain-containing protein n=1 Tax=Mycena venus TaxID=2733690 RepID=A0A8H6XVR9_9AGAR|nr:CAP10 domain-containing protein [Mycena venus]